MFRSFLIALAFLTGQAWAGPRIALSTPFFSVYKTLIADTIHDVEESRQEEAARAGASVNASEEGERELFISILTRFERDATADLPDFTLARSFEWAHGAGEVLASRARLEDAKAAKDAKELTLIPSLGADSGEHSMKDADRYSANRLGLAAFESVRSGRVSPEVFGGSLESLLANPAYPKQKLVRIPSTYEAWGIQKYLDVNAGQTGPPRLIYRVPPIQQYLEHYRAILEIAQSKRDPGPPLKAPEIWLHRADREKFFREISAEVKSLAAQFAGLQPEHAALGYYSQWESALASPQSPWTLKSVTHKDGAAGWLHGKILELAPKESACDLAPPPTVKVLTLSCERTLWGEASAQLTEAVLQEFPDLRGFFFLGSAGAPSGKLPLYGLGIPARFQLDGQAIALENALAPGAAPSLAIDHRGVVVGTGGTHGNSSSPGEQTQAWVSRQLKSGVDTVDVEQSRVAETVSRFNLLSGRKIQFGAINLITDRPSSVNLLFNDLNSLDQVDSEMKSKARVSAVETVLKTIDRINPAKYACVLPMKRRAEQVEGFRARPAFAVPGRRKAL